MFRKFAIIFLIFCFVFVEGHTKLNRHHHRGHEKTSAKKVTSAATTLLTPPPTSITTRSTKSKTQLGVSSNKQQTPQIQTAFIIDAPTNCGPGERLVGSQCRKIFNKRDTDAVMKPFCIINCPPCPDGQELDPNGICRPVWDDGDYVKDKNPFEILKRILGPRPL